MQNLQALGLVTMCTCLAVGYGCQDGSLPSPTAIASPAATDTERGRQSVRGRVTDPQNQPIAGALIEVLQDAASGRQAATTDVEGIFQLDASQRSGGDLVLRVSRDGFVPRIVNTSWEGVYEFPIWLDTGPAVDLQPGAYTLAVAFKLETARDAHVACSGFPVTLTSRSYRVQVGPASWTPSPDDRLVTLENAPFKFGDRFVLSIVGRCITLEEMDDLITEELPGIRFLGFSGGGRPGAPAAVAGKFVSFRLGWSGFQYCQLRYPLGHYHDCSQVPAEGIVDYRACLSDNATMTFTPR